MQVLCNGVGRTIVAYRLQLAELPSEVLGRFVENDFLRDSHAREIGQLSNFDNLEEWLTRDGARFVQIDFLNEGHAAEIDKLFNLNNLEEWLTSGAI